MNAYNGFTPAQRNRAQAWLREKWASGEVPKPSKCCICGQEHGVFDAHSEDYSEPFGPHLYKYPLCFPCHMILHCRFRNGLAFRQYALHVMDGLQTPPFFRRDWDRFTREYLETEGTWAHGPGGTVTFAEILDDGQQIIAALEAPEVRRGDQ